MDHGPDKKKRDAAKKTSKRSKGLLLGLGLDGADGHTRITAGENFRLVGGSKETHEVMQETALKVNEELGRRHKRLEDVAPQEFLEIMQKAKP